MERGCCLWNRPGTISKEMDEAQAKPLHDIELAGNAWMERTSLMRHPGKFDVCDELHEIGTAPLATRDEGNETVLSLTGRCGLAVN